MNDGISTLPLKNTVFMAATSNLTASPGSTSPILAPTRNSTAPAIDEETLGLSGSPEMNGICVFSGGTAANSLVDAFQAVASHVSARGSHSALQKRQACSLTYIIPISDNGGSSSELIRFFGGPSVGDIRSRLVRLIPTKDGAESEVSAAAAAAAGGPGSDGLSPASSSANERAALRALFEHRLCATDSNQARIEWLDLVEARHLLWTFVPSATRELIRAVLNTLNLEIVKRTRPSTSVFNFAGASVGNLFLTGARLFSGSFEAAIYLLSLLCGIPEHVAVLPAINSNFTHHISAGLVDGTTIAGQVNISHPSAPTSLPDGNLPNNEVDAPASFGGPTGFTSSGEPETPAAVPITGMHGRDSLAMRGRARTAVDFEDATLPGSLPVLRQPQISFSKEDEEDLSSRISRVWYINPYGHEIRPQANPKALAALRQAEAIIYSIGSLYTSIIPSLVLRGVGEAISEDSGRRKKILILNSKLDRETGPLSNAMSAVDFVRAIVGACKQSQADSSPVQDSECKRYVTHLVFLDNAAENRATATPKVDESELGQLGVRCVAVPSSQVSQPKQTRPGPAVVLDKKAMERYDQAALTRALESLIDGTLDREG